MHRSILCCLILLFSSNTHIMSLYGRAWQRNNSDHWREWSSEKLARNWLDFNLTQINNKIEAIQSQRTTPDFQPKHVSGPSYVEPGSMDANEWLVAELDPESNEDSEPVDYDLELMELDRKAELFEQNLRILEGKEGNDEDSAWLIYGHATLERQRREKSEKPFGIESLAWRIARQTRYTRLNSCLILLLISGRDT